jgi:hypothetical protein
MPIKHTRMCQSILFLGIVGFTFAISGRAHASTVNFQIAFSGHVDCHRPFNISHVPISGSGTGSLNSDGSATADIMETAFVLSSRIHFEARLGRSTPAPGGSAQVRVAGQHRLLLIWNLPNNQMVIDIAVNGRSCTARFESSLKPGKTEYTLFDGTIFHYCGRPTAETASCQVR